MGFFAFVITVPKSFSSITSWRGTVVKKESGVRSPAGNAWPDTADSDTAESTANQQSQGDWRRQLAHTIEGRLLMAIFRVLSATGGTMATLGLFVCFPSRTASALSTLSVRLRRSLSALLTRIPRPELEAEARWQELAPLLPNQPGGLI